MSLPEPYGEDGWLKVYKYLLPPGPFWDSYRRVGGIGEQILRSRAKVYAEYERRMYLLLGELIPSGALQSLLSREGEAGLPGCCSGTLSESWQARVDDVLRVWRDHGGINADYYISLADSLGMPDSTITTFSVFTCESECENGVFDESWHKVWRLNAPDVPVYEFTSESGCEEPLRLWGDQRLECEIKKRKPSGTFALVGYGGTI
jgi:uncharacterized protein YmfQ (DUF2313 family)